MHQLLVHLLLYNYYTWYNTPSTVANNYYYTVTIKTIVQ
jgi:hypothetical protein